MSSLLSDAINLLINVTPFTASDVTLLGVTEGMVLCTRKHKSNGNKRPGFVFIQEQINNEWHLLRKQTQNKRDNSSGIFKVNLKNQEVA